MQKASIFLLVVGVLIAVGIGLSFYGSQIIVEDLVSQEETLEPGSSLEVVSDLEPTVSDTGVYVVQILNFKPDSIEATLYDSFNSQVLSKKIEKDSFEERFDVGVAGKYRLVVENKGSESLHVIGVLGHLPDKSKFSVGLTGFYILIVGLVGIVGVGVYAIKNRKRKFS